jgi:predicted kinase
VQDFSNRHSLYVIAASPQETGLTAADFQRILNLILRTPLAQGLIAAIQPSQPTRRLRMEQMLDMARQSGFETFAFVLDPPRQRRNLQSFDEIRERILQADPVAQVVRLDGRRFAVLNAEAIRAISRVPF